MKSLRDILRQVPLFQVLRHPYQFIATRNQIKKNRNQIARLRNRTPTILSNDCIAGMLMKEYEIPCNTPMVNCGMFPDDYVKFLWNIEHYMKCPLVEKRAPFTYPVGELVSDLGNIEIIFMHYKSFHEAQLLWKRRIKRVDLNNMNIILDLNSGAPASEEVIDDFLKLPYNKVVLSTEQYYDKPNYFYIDVGDKKNVEGIILKFKNIHGERYYDDFDFIEWLNNNAK